jgi:diguanylate cyclase (GGDEF)-like protein
LKKTKAGSPKSAPSEASARRLDTRRELDWTRFALQLEQALGDLMAPEPILDAFGEVLKKQLNYDYLEVTRLEQVLAEEGDSAGWVRNETGYGGKLLSIILSPDFQRDLQNWRNPVLFSARKKSHSVENPDLLRVMNLQAGILLPLRQGNSVHGAIKVFFQRPMTWSAAQQKWLATTAAILDRSLQRAALFQKAQKMATVDGLTGLYNHRFFMEQFHKEFARARRYRNWLSLIIVDIDYFKHYNDANGHLAGDHVLRKVASAIKNCVREMDIVARYGGEEFALLLPEISGENGVIVAEKIRREVEVQRFRNERRQPNGQLTVSLGVAQNSPHLKSHREMFNLADAALYQAKTQGRNRCVFAK